ncbi:RHS repeat domain-containing protein [Fibrobacterota bacterium]
MNFNCALLSFPNSEKNLNNVFAVRSFSYTSQYEYDTDGYLINTISPSGKISTISYDANHNVSMTKEGDQAPPVHYSHDDLDRLVSLTDQANATTYYSHDYLGRMTGRQDPFGNNEQFTYIHQGSNQIDYLDRNNNSMLFDFYPVGDLKTVSDGKSTTTFTYNAPGRLINVHDEMYGPGDVSFAYDLADRVISINDMNNRTVEYEYDALGNTVKIVYPDGKEVGYTYDELNRLKTVTDWSGNTATYEYDADGAIIESKQFNGVVAVYDHDDAGRLTKVAHNRSDGGPIAEYSYVLDVEGNPVSIDELATTHNLDMVDAEISYYYDNKKMRMTSAQNSMWPYENESFTYDNEGQINEYSKFCSGSEACGRYYVYDFDSKGRLNIVVSERTAEQYYAQYQYDGLDRRFRAIRGSGNVTRYIYGKNNELLAETDESGNISKYYIYGNSLMAMVTSSGQAYYYHFDGNSNTAAITDIGQNVVTAYSYTPFGEYTQMGSLPVDNPFTFCGALGVMDDYNGMFYMRARYYSAREGRFISEDPIGYNGGDANLFGYGWNNPMVYVDPFGLCARGYSDFNLSITPIGTLNGVLIGGLMTGGNPIGMAVGGFIGSFGLYGGVMTNPGGTQYPYIGVSISPSKGPAVNYGWTVSDKSASEGLNVAVSLSAGMGFQRGYTFGEDDGRFTEAGAMTPGGSLNLFWSWEKK